MTTLIQSELDDLLRESTKFGASAFCRLKAVEKLRDHIAQLTAERDEAIADNDDCHIEIAGKDARIAALEAQLAGEREECAKVADKRASHACNECERLSGMDPETGAYECSLEVSGRGCLCNERMEEAEAIAAAFDAALKE